MAAQGTHISRTEALPSPPLSPVVSSSMYPLADSPVLTSITVSDKLFREKSQCKNLEGRSPKCHHWVLAFQSISLLSSLCFSYSSEIFTVPMQCITARVMSKAIKMNPRFIFFPQPRLQFSQLETSKSAFMSWLPPPPVGQQVPRIPGLFLDFRASGPPYFVAGLLQQPLVCVWSAGSGSVLLQTLSRKHWEVASQAEGDGGARSFASE